MKNTIDCPEAENDADRTVQDLMREIDDLDGYVSRSVLEASLYNCNMMDEDFQKVPKVGTGFWHPFGKSFNGFLDELLPTTQRFDKYFNRIVEREPK